MKVSVIIPMYNLEEYIEKSIKSILAQSLGDDFEIIVVDDGSRDNSYAVVEKICGLHSNIKLIHQKNEGVSAARNTGIEAASGKYILFVDGDDIMFPKALKMLIDTMEDTPDAILICGEHQRITSYDSTPNQPSLSISRAEAKRVLSILLTEKYNVSACAKIFVRELIGDIRFVTQKKINEDKYFLFEYLLKNKGTVIDINSRVYGYYIRNGSATNSSFTEATLDMLYFSQKIQHDIDNLCPELSDEAHYNNMVTHLAVLKKIIRSNEYIKHKELFAKVKKETKKLNKTLAKRIQNNHKSEVSVLNIGTIPYILCVKFFDFLNKRRKDGT